MNRQAGSLTHFPDSLPALALLLLLVSGCASTNVNPSTARPHTGYVDFYAQPPATLSWDIARLEPGEQIGKTLFSDYEPVSEPIVRLGLPPGRFQLRIGFLNRAILDPAIVEVEVRDGLITPVQVTFTEAGEAAVEDKRTHAGGTYYGRYGRSTKMRLKEATVFRIQAKALDPLPYLVKSQMPYALTPPP